MSSLVLNLGLPAHRLLEVAPRPWIRAVRVEDGDGLHKPTGYVSHCASWPEEEEAVQRPASECSKVLCNCVIQCALFPGQDKLGRRHACIPCVCFGCNEVCSNRIIDSGDVMSLSVSKDVIQPGLVMFPL